MMQEKFSREDKDLYFERSHAKALRKAWKKNSKKVFFRDQEFESIRAFAKHLNVSYAVAIQATKTGKTKDGEDVRVSNKA